jgi:hypothetical protein
MAKENSDRGREGIGRGEGGEGAEGEGGRRGLECIGAGTRRWGQGGARG